MKWWGPYRWPLKWVTRVISSLYTPPKSNIDIQNDGLENVSPFKHGYFWVSMSDFRVGLNFFPVAHLEASMTPGESEGSTRLPRALLADEPTTGLDAFQVPNPKRTEGFFGVSKKGVVKTLDTKKWVIFSKNSLLWSGNLFLAFMEFTVNQCFGRIPGVLSSFCSSCFWFCVLNCSYCCWLCFCWCSFFRFSGLTLYENTLWLS